MGVTGNHMTGEQVIKVLYPRIPPGPFLLAGFVDYPGSMAGDRHESHEFYQAVLVLEGGFFFVGPDDDHLDLAPLEVGIVPPGVYHRYGVSGTGRCTTFMINFLPPPPEPFGNIAQTFPGGTDTSLWKQDIGDRHLQGILADIRAECLQPGNCADAKMYALLTLVLSAVAEKSTRRPGDGENGAIPPAVMRALRFIEAHYRRPLILKDIAHAVNLSPSRLSELFRVHVGVSPMQYVKSYRLTVAERLLAGSAFTLPEIADYLGFNSMPYFSRAVRQHTGLPPVAFRRCVRSRQESVRLCKE